MSIKSTKEKALYRLLEDFVIIEVVDHEHKFIIRHDDFDVLMNEVYGNFQKGLNDYIQILEEWNECKRFSGFVESSIIYDVEKTLEAISLIDINSRRVDKQVDKDDLANFITFLNQNKFKQLRIYTA